MAEYQGNNKRKIIKYCIILGIILLVFLAIFFVYSSFIKPNNYLIQNKYYGFKLQTPKGWIAEEKTDYFEANIAKTLAECENDKSGGTTIYEIGAFRFKSQRYSKDLDILKFSTTGLPSGIILEITVDCVPNIARLKSGNYSGSFSVAGEKAIEQLLKSGDGEIRYITFFHNNLKYTATKYINISPVDKIRSDRLKESYLAALSKIISTFNFIK